MSARNPSKRKISVLKIDQKAPKIPGQKSPKNSTKPPQPNPTSPRQNLNTQSSNSYFPQNTQNGFSNNTKQPYDIKRISYNTNQNSFKNSLKNTNNDWDYDEDYTYNKQEKFVNSNLPIVRQQSPNKYQFRKNPLQYTQKLRSLSPQLNENNTSSIPKISKNQKDGKKQTVVKNTEKDNLKQQFPKRNRSVSPVRKCTNGDVQQFQNYRFLNQVAKPKNDNEDDGLYVIKKIYYRDENKDIFNLKKQDKNHNNSSQQQQQHMQYSGRFNRHQQSEQQQNNEDQSEEKENLVQKKLQYLKDFKDIQRSVERNQIQNQNNSRMQNLQYSEMISQNWPRTIGILNNNTEKNGQNLQLAHQKCGTNYAYPIAQALKQMPDIKSINLNDNRLDDQGIIEILKNLNNSTEEIELSNNQMGILNFRAVLQMIINDQFQIKILKLENCSLKDAHIEELYQIFSQSQSLQVLDLSKNQISKFSGNSLRYLFTGCVNLQEIYLHWNLINPEGGYNILLGINQKLFNGEKLKVFDISSNSIGSTQSSFWSMKVTQELVKMLNNCTENNLLHLDLSYNKFSFEAGKQIANSLKQNQSIIGFHFSGQGWYVNSRGFLKHFSDPNENVQQIATGVPQKIDSCRFKGYNLDILNQNINQSLNLKKGDNCWICEGWVETIFEWNKSSGEIKGSQKLFIHLEIDDYKPCQMKDRPQQGCFYVKRLVPPKIAFKYYFSTDGLYNALIARDKPTVELNPITVGYCKKAQSLTESKLVKKADFQTMSFQDQQKILDKIQQENEQEEDPPTFSTLNIYHSSKHHGVVNAQYQLNISLAPRLDYTGEVKNKRKRKNHTEWTIQQSIFKDYKLEDEQLIKKCFEFDWECTKIPNAIKNEDVLKKVKQIYKDMYPFIKNCYRYYSYLNITGDTPGLTMATFLEFLNGCSVIDGKLLRQEDVEIKFSSVNSQSKFKKSIRNPDKALIRYQFMEIIVRIAEDKYMKNQFTRKQDEALQNLFDEGYFYAIKRTRNAQEWREENLWTEESDSLLKNHLNVIKNVYNKFACSLKKKTYQTSKFLSLEEFKECLIHAKVQNNENITPEFINTSYGLSMMTQIDEINSDKYIQMQLIEFIEALARIAEVFITCRYKSPEMGKFLTQCETESQNTFSNKIHFEDDKKDRQPNKIKLHQKMELLIYMLYLYICDEDFKDQNPFPNYSQFKREA